MMEANDLDKFITKERLGVLKFILSKVKNPDLAEDLTQDVLMLFVNQSRNSDHIIHPQKYLFTIARNQVFDYWKKVASEKEEKEAYWREIQITRLVNNAPSMRNDRKIIFEQLSTQLTDQQKKIFFMSRQNGLSYKEIADQLNLSKSTVKNHMVTTLKIFRNFMNEHGDKFISLALLTFWVLS